MVLSFNQESYFMVTKCPHPLHPIYRPHPYLSPCMLTQVGSAVYMEHYPVVHPDPLSVLAFQPFFKFTNLKFKNLLKISAKK